jgi:hypothetical protein
MMSLGVWSCDNPRRFLALSEGFTVRERAEILRAIRLGLADSGQENTFRRNFKMIVPRPFPAFCATSLTPYLAAPVNA